MIDLKETVFDRFEIFYKNKRMEFTADPGFYNRKYNIKMGKLFIKILKELTKSE